MSAKNLESLFDGLAIETSDLGFDDVNEAKSAQFVTPVKSTAFEASAATPAARKPPPPAFLRKQRDVESPPVRISPTTTPTPTPKAKKEADADAYSDSDSDVPPEYPPQRSSLTFKKLYKSLEDSRKSSKERFNQTSSGPFRRAAFEDSRAEGYAEATPSNAEKTQAATNFAEIASAFGAYTTTAGGDVSTFFKSASATPVAAAAEEDVQQHYDLDAGIEAIKRAAATGEPARIHLPVGGKNNKLELFVKRSTKDPEVLLYATRLNDFAGTSAPVPMMRTNVRTKETLSYASWVDTQDTKHGKDSAKLLKSATKLIKQMVVAANVYDSSKSDMDEEH